MEQLLDEVLVVPSDGRCAGGQDQLQCGGPGQDVEEVGGAIAVQGPYAEVLPQEGVPHLIQAAPGLHRQPAGVLRA